MAAEETKARKARERPLIPTGIAAFDAMIGGGLPNGSVIAIIGDPGSGHRLFAQQILYFKARYEDVKVCYLTIEDPPSDVAFEMAGYGWNLDEVGDKWEFIDGYTPRLDVRRGVAGSRVILDLATLKLPSMLKEGKWTVIDTFSYYLLLYDLKDVLDIIDVLTAHARKYGGLHFLILIHGLHEQKSITTVSHFTDGLFDFNIRHEEAEATGIIRIKKLARAHHTMRSIPYRITSEGIMIETAVRIA
ncbi:MAG: hypothetical protein DRJ98_05215 [Thermoprotei archaeon]|nr:MAG: hypothetical protein DRJ98_05215 [Thermoprotei archaeon]RLF17891.1 MAG: hypothetical protein DRN06_02885 [Thermoprotei archaeon]